MWSLHKVALLGLGLLVVSDGFAPRLAPQFRISQILRASSTELPRSSPPPVQSEDDADEEDRKLELQMAREQYDTLRGDGPLLRTSQFLSWDEIVDVLDSGIIDRETMEIILNESGVGGEFMTFEQYFEVVDLVNQVSLALEEEEEDEGEGHEGNVAGGDDALNWLPQNNAEEEEPAVNQEAVERMLSAMGMKKKPK
jgi:hypothetical protein